MCSQKPEEPIKLDLQRWERWVQWAQRVRGDVKSALGDRVVFRGFSDVVRETQQWIAEHSGARFCEFVARSYVASVALAVRRHPRHHTDAVTLRGLLDQVQRCTSQLTLDFYIERFPGNGEDHFLATSTFKCVSRNGSAASDEIIKQDMDELERHTERVEAFVDTQLAHLDRRALATQATFNDLDAALDALDRVACKYLTLLTGGYRDTLEGTIQEPWMDVFAIPLQKPHAS